MRRKIVDHNKEVRLSITSEKEVDILYTDSSTQKTHLEVLDQHNSTEEVLLDDLDIKREALALLMLHFCSGLSVSIVF